MPVRTVLLNTPLQPSAARDELLRRLTEDGLQRGLRVVRCPDVVHLPEDSPVWGGLRRAGGLEAVFGWVHPRPLRWVLHRHGIEVAEERCHDLSALTNVEAVPGLLPEAETGQVGEVIEHGGEVSERWFPVMDRSLCIDCGHCLQFCIFGVYSRDEEGHVYTAAPDNCKPGCPACARVCPVGAIMFPLCESDRAIAGAPGEHVVLDAAARRMYYDRTGAPCPVCGLEGEFPGDTRGPTCPECGRPVPPAGPADAPVFAEIDALIDELDELSGGL